jgi:hypothetical protein
MYNKRHISTNQMHNTFLNKSFIKIEMKEVTNYGYTT